MYAYKSECLDTYVHINMHTLKHVKHAYVHKHMSIHQHTYAHALADMYVYVNTQKLNERT